MKFSKPFKLISLVILFGFLIEIFSPALVLAANFSKKGKYHLNSFTPVPIPIQPKVKSQRSLVNKIMEENVEKPPRTAFYKNGKLLFAREYPELAKRPNTAKELKKYYQGNFYPSPVPAGRTFIPYKHGGVPPEPFKNPPPGVPLTSPQTMFPANFDLGFSGQRMLLAFNDYGNFPLGIFEDGNSTFISQNDETSRNLNLVSQQPPPRGYEPGVPLGFSRQFVQGGSYVSVDSGGTAYANDFQDHHYVHQTFDVPSAPGSVSRTGFIDYTSPVPSWNSTLRGTWTSIETRVENFLSGEPFNVKEFRVFVYLYNADYPGGTQIYYEQGPGWYTEDYNHLYFPTPNILGTWHYSGAPAPADLNVRELRVNNFNPDPEVLYTDSQDGFAVDGSTINGNNATPDGGWKPGNPEWHIIISNINDPNNPVRVMSGNITNDPNTGQSNIPFKNGDGTPVFWAGKMAMEFTAP